MADKTIFDKILAKEIPAKIVYEDDDVLAFNDVNPQAPIHVLVIPKIRIIGFPNFVEKSDEFVACFIKKVAKVAKLLKLEDDGYRIVFNSGKHGQQTVNYIHAHILGGRQLNWPPG